MSGHRVSLFTSLLRVPQRVLQSNASSSFFLFAPPASFFAGSLKEARSKTIPEMPAPGQTSASNKGYGNAKGKLESICFCCDETQRESASPISFNHLRALQGNSCSTAVQPFFFPLLIYRWIWLKEPACGRNMDPEEKGLISKQEIWQGVYLLIGEQKGNTNLWCLRRSGEWHRTALNNTKV